MTDRELIAQVEACKLALADFKHVAHVRLARAYLLHMPLPEAMIRFRDSLKAFAAHYGKSGLYHETITFSFLMLIHEWMIEAPSDESFEAFAERNPDVVHDGKAALLKLYQEETLISESARKRYRLPDRLPSR